MSTPKSAAGPSDTPRTRLRISSDGLSCSRDLITVGSLVCWELVKCSVSGAASRPEGEMGEEAKTTVFTSLAEVDEEVGKCGVTSWSPSLSEEWTRTEVELGGFSRAPYVWSCVWLFDRSKDKEAGAGGPGGVGGSALSRELRVVFFTRSPRSSVLPDGPGRCVLV